MIISKDCLPSISMLLISMNNVSLSSIVMWSYNEPNNPLNQPHTQGWNPMCSIFDVYLYSSNLCLNIFSNGEAGVREEQERNKTKQANK